MHLHLRLNSGVYLEYSIEPSPSNVSLPIQPLKYPNPTSSHPTNIADSHPSSTLKTPILRLSNNQLPPSRQQKIPLLPRTPRRIRHQAQMRALQIAHMRELGLRFASIIVARARSRRRLAHVRQHVSIVQTVAGLDAKHIFQRDLAGSRKVRRVQEAVAEVVEASDEIAGFGGGGPAGTAELDGFSVDDAPFEGVPGGVS